MSKRSENNAMTARFLPTTGRSFASMTITPLCARACKYNSNVAASTTTRELVHGGILQDQTGGIKDETPFALETQCDRGFERFDLGEVLGGSERLQGNAEKTE